MIVTNNLWKCHHCYLWKLLSWNLIFNSHFISCKWWMSETWSFSCIKSHIYFIRTHRTHLNPIPPLDNPAKLKYSTTTSTPLVISSLTDIVQVNNISHGTNYKTQRKGNNIQSIKINNCDKMLPEITMFMCCMCLQMRLTYSSIRTNRFRCLRHTNPVSPWDESLQISMKDSLISPEPVLWTQTGEAAFDSRIKNWNEPDVNHANPEREKISQISLQNPRAHLKVMINCRHSFLKC